MRLDRLGIIELPPGNRARALTARNFRWLPGGPMGRRFRRTLLGDYFAGPFDGELDALYLHSGSLSADGVARLKARLEDLARDAALLVAERTGVSPVLAHKLWMMRLFESYLKSGADPLRVVRICGYHFGDYFAHWLSFEQLGAKLPKIFHVNWFRKGADGRLPLARFR